MQNQLVAVPVPVLRLLPWTVRYVFAMQGSTRQRRIHWSVTVILTQLALLNVRCVPTQTLAQRVYWLTWS